MRLIPSRAAVDAFCGCRTTVYQRVAGILAPAIYAGVFLLIALRWRLMPERIPTHYDFAGNVNGWGSRWTLVILPAIGLLTDIVIAVSMRFPRSWNAGVRITVVNKARVYRVLRDFMADMRLAMALVFAFISVWIILGPGKIPGWGITAATLGLTILPIIRYFIRLMRAK